ncbi:hypothetical protein ACLOJK_035660 [Asimina triloba]
MSTAIGYSGPADRLFKKSAHRRNDSGELDVFEAARYFSGAEATGIDALRKAKREERLPALEGYGGGGARKSLDVPMQGPLPGPDQSHRIEKSNKEKKSKQPSSPGGRLASFLNSLFSQTSSKKKSKSSSASKSVKDEEDSPLGRRKRRSSVSHFQSVSSNSIANDSKSAYSSSRSGFRTPPAYSNTPTKVFKDQKIGGPLSKYNGQQSQLPVGPREEGSLGVNKDMSLSWLDEKFKFSDGFLEKNRIVIGSGLLEKDRGWAGGFSLKEELRKAASDQVDDGGESDSSSDLFELQNYDLGVYSNGLPVYETTRMESIRRGAPIASGTL